MLRISTTTKVDVAISREMVEEMLGEIPEEMLLEELNKRLSKKILTNKIWT